MCYWAWGLGEGLEKLLDRKILVLSENVTLQRHIRYLDVICVGQMEEVEVRLSVTMVLL